ncbi:MAG: protein kinase domain-containing protein [Gaiellaceae bacterium]
MRVKLDQRIGTELGGYRIVEQLGRGGTSVVYRAEHVRLGRGAALKLLSPGLGEADFSDRFLRESRLAASLDHPNIVPVYDAGEDDGLLWIAMACIEGTDLKTLIAEEGRLPVRRALSIVGQIASALDAAHARGLVHRDVKPANVLVGPGDRAYLSDFGAVKELSSAGLTRTGAFVGTIEYCAPEQIEGGEVDARTDVYALGCVLYEALTGEPPFHRPSEVAVLNAHLHSPPPRPSKTGPGLPSALDGVIAKALAKAPVDRYDTPGDLVAAARAAVAERKVDARRLVLSVSLLVLAALLGAGIALGVRATWFGGSHAQATTSTVSLAGQQQQGPFDLSKLLELQDGRSLYDISYILIGAKRYADALPFARRAYHRTHANPLHAYATYAYGYTLYKQGDCKGGIALMQASLPIQPPRWQPAVRRRITAATKRCSRS